jgi:hypothetical protein
MATNPKHPPGPPMTWSNMREEGVHHLIAYLPQRRLPPSGSDFFFMLLNTADLDRL